MANRRAAVKPALCKAAILADSRMDLGAFVAISQIYPRVIS